MKVIVAEKPSVARDLAFVLKANTRRDGYIEGNGYQITWAFGHLVTLKEPGEYDPALKRWTLDSLPFIPQSFELKLIKQKGVREQFGIIKGLLRDADEWICATDAGREGELIFRYILQLSGQNSKRASKPFKRLWLSSLTPGAIKKAFQQLRPGSDFDRLYDAARCRSEADWIVGLNATRNYTVRHRADGVLWSVGRVQTPVLAMIARRDDEIRNFDPKPFWELQTVYRKVTFSFKGPRFKEEAPGKLLYEKVLDHPFKIKKVEAKPERELPPQLHDLTELQREMNRRFGISAANTLKAAQSLYEGKIITYPRTDSRYLTQDMKPQIPGLLEKLRSLHPQAIGALDLAALPFSARIVNDANVRDHHALLPTGRIPGSLPPDQQKIFDTLVIRLIAIFYPPCIREVTTVEGEANQVLFKAKGSRVKDPGWTVLIKSSSKAGKTAKGDKDKAADSVGDKGQKLPAFEIGEEGPHVPQLKKGETKPPRPFTENALLGAMETAGRLVDDEQLKEAMKDKGLGTPATRAAIIETLIRRAYITRDKKNLCATDMGRYLIALIQDAQLKSAELTGEWEGKLKAIEEGRLEAKVFMEEIAEYTRRLISESSLLRLDFNSLGTCPRCGKGILKGHKGYGCSGWKEGCSFVLWPEYKGLVLQDRQIRELLQRRVLTQSVMLPNRSENASDASFSPGARVVLCLSEAGVLMELQLPSKDQQGAQKGKGSGAGKGQASPKAGKRKPRAPKQAANGANSTSGATGTKGKAKKGSGQSRSIGACPSCGSEVMEREKCFGCSGWRQGCSFVVWKQMAKRKIGVRVATALLKNGRSDLIKGFKSKAGKSFDACLKLENGQVKFDFGNG